MIWQLFDHLFGWTKEIEKEARNAKLREIRQNVAAKRIQRAYSSYKERNTILMKFRQNVAAKCIQKAYRSYIIDKYYFDRRIQSEAAKKIDENDKNIFEKLIVEDQNK